MKYTVRFAHLESTGVAVGEIIKPGRQIGIMGNTGSGTGPHLHLDCVVGEQIHRYTLNDIANHTPIPAAKQAVLFIDDLLFNIKPIVTTHYADPAYYRKFNKVHEGFDVVPEDRHVTSGHFGIHWNRSVNGRVVNVVKGDPGYGTYVMIAFDI